MTDAPNPSAAKTEPVLLPCPFCGDDGEVRQTHDEFSRRRSVVVCRGCGARSDASIGDLRASNEWNTRTHPQPSLSVGLDREAVARVIHAREFPGQAWADATEAYRAHLCMTADAILALAAPAEGYVLVPVEPTEDAVKRAASALAVEWFAGGETDQAIRDEASTQWAGFMCMARAALIAACLPAAPTGETGA